MKTLSLTTTVKKPFPCTCGGGHRAMNGQSTHTLDCMIWSKPNRDVKKSTKYTTVKENMKNRCQWSTSVFVHNKVGICEVKSLLGNWSPVCKSCLNRIQKSIWSGVFKLETRPLKNL